VNNLKNNLERTLRKPACRKPARGCEPHSEKLSSLLSSLFPTRLSVTDGDTTRTYTYHADGQLASATVGSALRGGSSAMVGSPLRGDRGRVISPERSEPRKRSLEGRDAPLPETETFIWDGLALIQRGDEQFMNEPHVGGGNPVASSKGTSYFNDALGTTVGSKSSGKYSAAALTAFGEPLETLQGEVTSNIKHQTSNSQNFFTGKPFVEGLGHAFLMRNYRAGLAKWQTADPMGYPDGWNQLAYCNNGVTSAVDLWGCVDINLFEPGTSIYDMAEDFNPSNVITVASHGNKNGPLAGGISVEDLKDRIKALDKWDGKTSVYLLSCEAGAGDYPQRLANALGVNVIAPETKIMFYKTSDNVVHVKAMPKHNLDTSNHWKVFKPE